MNPLETLRAADIVARALGDLASGAMFVGGAVPALIVTVEGVALRDGGVLADVAPTVLALLGVEQPSEMTGRSLLADDG